MTKKEYASKGVTIGNGKIRIGLPGINKDIVLDANDIETFKQSLVIFLDLILKISGGNLFIKIGYRHCFYNGRIDNIIYLSYY